MEIKLTPEWVSAFFAGAAILFTIITFLRTRTMVKSQVFIELRYRFIEIYDKLPEDYKSDTWLPDKETKEWTRIQQYWYHAFNEWFVTNKLDRWYLKPLWNKYYSKAIWNGLKYAPMRHVLIHMTSNELDFAGYSAEFERVLERIWKKFSSKALPLRDSVKDISEDKNTEAPIVQSADPCVRHS